MRHSILFCSLILLTWTHHVVLAQTPTSGVRRPPIRPSGRPGVGRDADPSAGGPARLVEPDTPPEGGTPTAGAVRFYVRAGANGGAEKPPKGGTSADGKSWATAFTTIQPAIAATAQAGGGEVWVAKGTYRPTDGADREATFHMRSGVALYGGFAGTEVRCADRDWQRNRTILSGDIGRPAVPTDHSHHVVTGADNALLDGFVVSDGYALDAGGPPLGGQRPGDGPPGSPSALPVRRARGKSTLRPRQFSAIPPAVSAPGC